VIRRTLRALPTLMKVGLSEAIAFRAEMIVWVLATTMPFVMLVLWTSVAKAAPIVAASGKAWGSGAFTAYFLSVFIVRQLITSWAAWEINFEVRQGTLSSRLLRPIHPILSYGAANVAAMPLRFVVAIPVLVVMAFLGATKGLPTDPRLWLIWVACMVGAWLITFFANITIGALSLFMESSIKVMDVWLASFFIFSGYLFPLELFPEWLRALSAFLPFRFQIGLPVDVMTGKHSVEAAALLLGQQWLWVLGFGTVAVTLWNTGVKRFQAFGG
jgi:ABC-2 type transport system permease protein